MRGQKRDKNEPEIRKRAEALGFLWLENTASTKGRPDACLLRNGKTYWCEVKEPGASYTPAQVREFPRLIAKGVPVYVLETPEHIVWLAADGLRPWAPDDAEVVRDAKGQKRGKQTHRAGHSRARDFDEMCCAHGCVTSRRANSIYCAKCAGEGMR